MKKVINVLFLVILFGCIDTDSDKPFSEFKETITEVEDSDSSSNDDSQVPPGAVEVTLIVTLPAGSTVSEEDLLVSSLLSVDKPIVGGESNVNVFDSNGYEISFAEDVSGNVVLMNYFNSGSDLPEELSASSTAIAMVMMLPWTADLSVEAKSEAVELIQARPEYSNLVAAIDNSLKEGTNTFENEQVIQARDLLLSELFNDLLGTNKQAKYDDEEAPLAISADGNTITIINNNSSMAYGVKINNEETVFLDGVSKKILSLDNFSRFYSSDGGSFFQPTHVAITANSNIVYDVLTGNGLSTVSSDAGEFVRSYNAGKLTVGILTAISGGLGNFISSDKCIRDLGTFVINRGLDVTQFAFSNRPKDLLQGTINLLSGSSKDALVVLGSCASSAINNQSFLSALKSLNLFLNTVNTVETGILVFDWLQYDSEIVFCTDKNDGSFKECKPLFITGDASFGEIPVGLIVNNEGLTLENRSQSSISITKVTLPNQSYSVQPNNGLIEIPAGETRDLSLFYNAQSLEELTGDIVIETDLTEEGNFPFSVSGSVINPLEVTDQNGIPVTELVYNNTVLNTPESKQIQIKNISDYDVQLFGSDPPADGFTYSWAEQPLTSDTPINLEFIFQPTEAKRYDPVVAIKNESSQIPNLSLIGDGIASILDLQIEGGSYDFGQVEIGQSATKVLTITNNSSDPTEITNIGDTNIYSVDKKVFTIQAQQSEMVVITFAPQEATTYNNQEIPIVNEAVDNLVISLSGEGIENNSIDLSGEWMPTWQVDQCDILGTYCCGCSFHQNTRNFIFIGEYQCSSTQFCGQLDWNTQQIGSSDTPITNNWTLTGDRLSIELQSGQSSGFQFTDRTLTWEGQYDPATDSFTGEYVANFYGGLIISAEARGTLTLKRIEQP